MIIAKHLSFTYPSSKSETFSDLQCEVRKGTFAILEAPGGSGKSTFIKLLLGVYQPTLGQLEVNGFDVRAGNQIAALRRSIGVVSEGIELMPDRTAKENVVLPLELADRPAKDSSAKVTEILHRFGLDEVRNEFPQTLSEGERRKVKLARALVTEPHLLILDEPTLGLDPATGNTLWDLLFREHQRGMTILATVSSLPPDERFSSCQRIAFAKGS